MVDVTLTMPAVGGRSGRRDAHIGRRIRGKRRAMGLEQIALARMLGVAVDRIDAYETGATAVPAEQLRQLADYFGVPLDYFLPKS